MSRNMAWQDAAACLDEDPELFFLNTPNAIEAAKKVCAGCDVRAQCEQYAKDVDAEFGVWGNATEGERAALKVVELNPVRPNPPTFDKRCGTYPGSQAHRRRSEAFCDPCRVARNERENGRKKQRRAARRLEVAS